MRGRKTRRERPRGGFTLVEIMIVIVLLAILAMLTVPRILSAQDEAKESALATDVQMLRRQIELYKIQHMGRAPHVDQFGQKDIDNMKARMLGRTDPDGQINASGPCGPYMNDWPENPFCDAAVAADVAFGKPTIPPRDDTTGWYYCIRNTIIFPNSSEGALDLDSVGG